MALTLALPPALPGFRSRNTLGKFTVSLSLRVLSGLQWFRVSGFLAEQLPFHACPLRWVPQGSLPWHSELYLVLGLCWALGTEQGGGLGQALGTGRTDVDAAGTVWPRGV